MINEQLCPKPDDLVARGIEGMGEQSVRRLLSRHFKPHKEVRRVCK